MSEGEERPVQGGQFEMGWGSDVIAQMLRDFGIAESFCELWKMQMVLL